MNILKRYAKGFSISVLAVSALCMGASTALAQGNIAPAAAQSASIPQNLLGVVKLPPLPSLGEKVLLISQKAELDPQTQMFMMFFLSQYGFPAFPGVSASDDVTLFALSTEAQAGANADAEDAPAPTQFVIFAKIAADSPVRGVLESQSLLVQDHEGWTLIAIDPSAFSAIKDFSGLAAIAASKGHFDIEARGYSSKAIKDMILGYAEAGLAEQEAKGDEAAKVAAKARAWLQFAIGVLDEVEWAGYGLSVNAENVSLGFAAAPKAGTAGAKFVNTQQAGGKVKAGAYFPADVAIGYVGQYDIPATVEYIKSLSKIAKGIPDEQAAALVQQAIDEYLPLVAASDGGGAGVVTKINLITNEIGNETIQTGKFELSAVDGFYGYIFNKLLPEFFALIDADQAEEMTKILKAEVKTDAAKIEGQSVSVVVYATPDPEDESKTITQDTYYVVINGALLSADNLDSLKALAAVYAAGKPVANSLADAYPLPANTWLKGAVNIKKLAHSIADTIKAEDAEADLSWLAQLDALEIKPVLFDAKAERGHAVYAMSLSLDSVMNLVKLAMANQGAEAEEVEITEVQITPAN